MLGRFSRCGAREPLGSRTQSRNTGRVVRFPVGPQKKRNRILEILFLFYVLRERRTGVGSGGEPLYPSRVGSSRNRGFREALLNSGAREIPRRSTKNRTHRPVFFIQPSLWRSMISALRRDYLSPRCDMNNAFRK